MTTSHDLNDLFKANLAEENDLSPEQGELVFNHVFATFPLADKVSFASQYKNFVTVIKAVVELS